MDCKIARAARIRIDWGYPGRWCQKVEAHEDSVGGLSIIPEKTDTRTDI